jgi:hypothetical protein
VEGVIGNYPFLASGVNAQVNPCVICRNFATACDDLAPFASAEIISFALLGQKRHKYIYYPFPDYMHIMFISASF